VPGRVVLSRTLRDGRATPADAALVKHALGRVPSPAEDNGFRVTAARVSPDGRAVTLAIASTLPLERPEVFVETGDGHRFGEPRVMLGSERRAAIVSIPLDALESRLLSPSKPVTLTIVDGKRTGEATVTPER
jgi:DsbC/DsbD-like thiol-disulfide interchange protein